MDAALFSTRQARAQHRHELRSLTYLTLDDTNGGVVRNLAPGGIGAQILAPVRPRQRLRVRFELKYPRLRVEIQGEVMWATLSGQCGIRFIDLPSQMGRQIGEWIFGDLLEGISLHADPAESMFAAPSVVQELPLGEAVRQSEQQDGLLVSAAPVKVIELPSRREPVLPSFQPAEPVAETEPGRLDWLSQPLSARSLAWAIHTLVVVAGLLLFALVFLSINREATPWPLSIAAGAVIVVAGLYWIFFHLFGGTSLGTRLARLAGYSMEEEQQEKATRFR
ncbi:MAG TPA: PilZ domain-containing protein [Candidatus Acidoferrales bacterium]|nr:PilZ domain-containing protein [Candidatus Acidoferrales bacterium]